MKKVREPVRFLAPAEMLAIHKNALRILAEIGMRIDHDDALDYLRSAGCVVDRESRRVHFPEDLVQRCVDKMRSDFASRRSPERMSVRYSHVRFRAEEFSVHDDYTVSAGGYCMFIYDLQGIRRKATLQDTRDALKLVAQLDQVTHSGIPVAAQEVPLPLRPIRMAAELVKATDKLGGIEAMDAFDVEYICRIGEVVRGSREELRNRPILIGYGEARTPLTVDHGMCEVFLEYVRRGMPQSLDTMPNVGATAPMEPAAALSLGIAETLGGMVLGYAVDANACVTIDVTPSYSDMTSGIFKYAGAERVALLGARIQMISEFYGCPSGVHGGKTDSCVPDVRCGLEKGISMIMPILCGAVGFGTIGHLENAVTFSPAQLVMDNEVARYVRRAVQGFEVNEETLAFDEIRSVGIGGHYLREEHTARRFRDLLNLSPFFSVQSWGSYMDGPEKRDWAAVANQEACRLLANDLPSPLSKSQEREVDAIVQDAEARLVREGRL
jgi:trimethylamine---corrinoid protein Co-methyltransferase